MHRFISLYISFLLILTFWSVANVYSLSDWELDFLRIEYNTSNAEMADFNIRIIRSKSGIYALNGSFVLGIDFDDTFTVSLKVYRSQSGSSQYRETPYAISKVSFYKFMTTVYVRLLQNEFSKCTNMPVHDDKFDTPLPKNTYKLNMCVVSNEKMPGHLQPGIYKVTVQFTRDNFEGWITGYFDIKSKSIGWK